MTDREALLRSFLSQKHQLSLLPWVQTPDIHPAPILKPIANSFLSPSFLEGGSLTPVRDSPCTPRLRSVSSYGNIRAVTTARNLNKSLQNLSLTEECKIPESRIWGGEVQCALQTFIKMLLCPLTLPSRIWALMSCVPE